MNLPNGRDAQIDRRKLVDYLLSPDHDLGKHKARLFRELLGITQENVEILESAILNAAIEMPAAFGHFDQFGQRYHVDLEFQGQVGVAWLRSVWITPRVDAVPRFVTCYII